MEIDVEKAKKFFLIALLDGLPELDLGQNDSTKKSAKRNLNEVSENSSGLTIDVVFTPDRKSI